MNEQRIHGIAEPPSNDAAQSPLRLLRLSEVLARVGLKKSAIYARIRAGMFPKPVDLGGVVAWVEAEIDAWIAEQIRKRDEAA